MTKIKRFAAMALAFLMIFSSVSVAAFAWDPNTDDSNEISIRTEILRTEADGDLVATEKVKKGETVKVRVYADTGYYTNAGTLLFFFNNSFFEPSVSNFNVGSYYKALPIGMTAEVFTEETSIKEILLVALGVIDQTFADANNFVLINYLLDSQSKNIQLNGDAVLFEMDLKVKSDASATDVGKFFIKESTILSTSQQYGEVNIPKGPHDGYNSTCVSMNGWNPEFTIEDSQVELFENFVSATFDADGGLFEARDAQGNKKSVEIMEGEAGDALTIAEPEKNNSKFNGWLASGSTTATDVTTFPSANTTYTASWESTVATDKTLAFKTEFYRKDGTEWVKTQKVKPGEEVELRLFVDTSYYTNAGEIILFFDNDFFLNPTGVKENVSNALTFNNDPDSSAYITGAHGEYMYISNKNFVIKRLIDNGCISSDFANEHGAYTLTYKFAPTTGNIISGDEWFVSIPMIVSPDATGTGDCFIADETLLTPDRDGYINIPISAEGLDDDYSEGLWLWEVALTTESYPVSIDSSITFDANGGAFAEGDPNTFVIEDVIGEKVNATLVPEVVKPGSTFLGWAVEGTTEIIDIPAEMPHDDLKLVAQWISKVDITFVPNNGDAPYTINVTPFEPFVAPEAPSLEGNRFVGWTTDKSLNSVTGLDATYPETAKTYYAVFESKTYTVTYYVISDVSGKPEFASKAQNSYGDVIAATPVRYEIPTGYELSKAYTDLTLKNEFVEGTTQPAENINLYYTLKAKTYNAEFDPNGGYFDGDETATASKIVPTRFEQAIVVPAAPEKEGYTFKGWNKTPSIMDEEGKKFIAVWEADTYTVEYYTDAGIYEAYEVAYNDSLDVPQDPEKDGYTFAGWADVNIAEPAESDIITPEALAATTMPMKDVSYKAVFVINKYNATFDAGEDAAFPNDDDDDTRRETVEVTFDDAIALPENPVKEGYTFTGWVDENGNAPGKMPAEDAAYTATWKVNQYTLVYVADGKELYSGEVDFGSLVADKAPAADAVAKTGYDFIGWSGTPAYAADTTMPANTVTYYAVYEVKAYDAVFNAGEGTFVEAGADGDDKTETVSTNYGEAIAVPELNDREGYVFDGWYDSEGNKATIPNVMPAEGLEYTAKWVPATNTPYEIYVYTQNTDGSYTETVFEKTGTTGTDATYTPAPETGFHVSDEQTNVLTAEIAADGSTDLTVYYDRDVIKVSFDANTGDAADVTSTDYLYGSIVKVPEVTRTGYTFEGWTLAADTDTVVDVQVLAENAADYVAKWTVNEYTVTYFADGVQVAQDTFDYDAAITKNAVVPTKTGYTFAYWYETDPNTEYAFGANMGTENIALNAKFTPNKYNAVFYKETTDTEPHDTVETEFDSAIKAPATTPTKQGYKFNGWSTNGVDKLANLGKMDTTAGKKFYAVWTPDYVDYKVEHYMMDTEGTYNVAPQVEDLMALTGDEVTATIKTVTGFVQDTDASLGTVLTATAAADGSTVLKVYYERLAYELTIDKNNGEANEVIEYYYGEEIADINVAYEGHVFNEWVDANDATYTVPDTMPNNDLYIKATWDLASYKVTYMNGATEVDFGFSNYSEDVYVTTSVPPKAGYKFAGWLDADNKAPADYATMPAKELVFQAQWEIRTDMPYNTEIYLMDTEGNYPTDATTKQTLINGVTFETVTFDPEIPAGFTLDESGNVTNVLSAEIPATGTATLVAYLARNKHVLKTTVGTEVTNNVEYYFGEDIAPIADPVKTGYDFIGWFDAEGNKVDLLNPGKMDDKAIIVTAEFEVQTYDAIFNAGEGATFPNGATTQTIPVDYNDAITAPDTNPSKTGYEFKGWSTDGSTVITDFGNMGTADVTYVPVWEKSSYVVTYYVLNPETMANEVVATAEVLYGEAIAATPAGYTVPAGYDMSAAYTDAAFTTAFAAGTTMPASDMNLYFKLTAKTYTIEFNEAEGSEVADITAAYKATVAKPADPTRTGYEFLGWYEDGATDAYVFSTMPLNGTKLTAKWNPIEYTITFDENGGSTVQDIKATYAAAITAPVTTLEGYEFLGWFEAGATTAYTFNTMPAENVQLQAKWEVKSYDATFNAGEGATFPNDNDGDNTSETINVNYGDNVILPENPVKEGYTFAGWEDENGNVPGKMPAADATYTATWTVNKYTLIYVADGKELYKGEVDFGSLVADKAPAADAVAKTGYDFTGWAGTPAYAADTTMPANTVTYYATYDVNAYDTVFNAGEGTFVEAGTDGDDKTETVSTNYGEAIAVPELNDRPGYDFAGWADENGNIVSIPDVMPAEDLELTATWTPAKDTPYVVKYYTQGTDATYPNAVIVNRTGTTDAPVTADQNPPEGFHVDTEKSVLKADKLDAEGNTVLEVYYARNEITVKFEGAGGVMNIGNGDQYTITTVYLYGQTVKAPVPTRTGYEFTGWDKDVVLIANEDASYTATWKELPFTVTYVADGKTVAEDTFDFTKPIVKNEIVPELKGHNFAFWYETDENTEYIFGGAMPARNIVLNAKFVKGSYEAEFYKELTDTNAYIKDEVTFEDEITAPATPPSKPGYDFAGWSTDGVTKLDNLGKMDEEGKTFYALWTAKNVGYTVEYYLMKTDGTYDPFATDFDDTLTAPTDSEITVTAKDIEHFAFDKENANNVLSATVAADGNTVLKLYYTRNKYTLTVNKDDGTDVQTNSYYYEQRVPAAAGMNKEGHKFSHWVNAAGETVTYPTTLTADMSVKAIWIANVHTLTYNVVEDDGTITAWHTQTLEFGKPVFVPNNNPAKIGYGFGGWLDADGKQPSDYGTMPDTDLVFTAQWHPDDKVGYTLNIFEMDVNGNYPTDPTTVLTFTDGVVGEERAPGIKVPAGFILDAQESNISGTIPAPSVGKLVLNAYFQRNLWKLTTVVNGTSTVVNYYYQAPVSVADPVVEGSKFLGWYDSAEYTTAVTIDPTMPNNDVTIYAKMDVQSYEVTFNAGEGMFDDGSNAATESLPFGTAISAPVDEPVLEGYTFGGWALSTAPDVKVEDFGTVGEADVEYVAIWTKSAYSVKFYDYSNERGPAVSNDKYLYSDASNLNMGSAIPFPADPAIKNYVFLGWSTAENGKDNLIAPDATMPAEDLVLYAVYDRVKVELIKEPTNNKCTTVIDRAGLTVDDYVEGESKWYVYGLKENLNKATLESKYIDVAGDGHAEIIVLRENYGTVTGTGTIINVYDDVTGKIVESFRVIIFGDLNGDARIDATDDSMISDELMGVTSWSYETSEEYCDYRKKAANLTGLTLGDNRVDVSDATGINSHVLGSAQIVQLDGSRIYA